MLMMPVSREMPADFRKIHKASVSQCQSFNENCCFTYFADTLKTLGKVHRACAEREILDMLDHPFLPALYASFQMICHGKEVSPCEKKVWVEEVIEPDAVL